MTSLSHGYLNHAPYRAIRATEDFEKLLEVVERAKETIQKVFEKEESQQ